MRRSKVVLPHPDGPRRVKNSFDLMVSEIPSSATTVPPAKRFTSFRQSTAISPAAGEALLPPAALDDACARSPALVAMRAADDVRLAGMLRKRVILTYRKGPAPWFLLVQNWHRVVGATREKLVEHPAFPTLPPA